MSVPVALPGLSDRIDERGPAAYLVTTNADLSPHVVSVVVEQRDGRFVLSAGNRTRANAERTRAVTLLWAAGADDPYSLLVDGEYEETSDADEATSIVVVPRSAILHRMAGRDDGPTCRPIDEPPSPA